jgi:hypothetical protein
MVEKPSPISVESGVNGERILLKAAMFSTAKSAWGAECNKNVSE